MIRRHRLTEEEKVAMKIANLVCDLRTDLEQVGVYYAQLAPLVAYNRLQVIAESAKAQKENIYDGTNQYTLF
jgi:hypothetical protein